MTKQITKEWKEKEYHRKGVSNLLSKTKGIIAKDEVILGFIGVMQKEIRKERKINILCIAVNPITIT